MTVYVLVGWTLFTLIFYNTDSLQSEKGLYLLLGWVPFLTYAVFGGIPGSYLLIGWMVFAFIFALIHLITERRALK